MKVIVEVFDFTGACGFVLSCVLGLSVEVEVVLDLDLDLERSMSVFCLDFEPELGPATALFEGGSIWDKIFPSAKLRWR